MIQMNEIKLQDLKYPIGEFVLTAEPTKDLIHAWIDDIESFPNRLHEVAEALTVEELNYHYRPEGWKIKQVIHHCVDSHTNCLIRFKWALTEDRPTIKPYFEDRWARLPGALDDDVASSLQFLKVLHIKMTDLMRGLTNDQLARTFIHPDAGDEPTLAQTVGQYAWHSNHHLAHVHQGLEFKNDFKSIVI